MKQHRQLAAAPLLLAVILLSTGCGGKPRIDPLTASSTVVAFGDSLTSGSGARQAENYPSVLANILGCRVVNAGIAGEVSSAGLRRLPDVLQRDKPDLVILCHGGNDMLGRKDPDHIRANLDAMIRQIKETGADVILVGVPKPGLLLRSPGLYRELAKHHAIPYEADIVPDILSTRSLKSDRIHPNAAGYRRLAEAVAALIRASQSAPR